MNVSSQWASQRSVHGYTGEYSNYPKVLAKELKELEQYPLIKRQVIEGYPVKISYQLEAYADTLIPIIYTERLRAEPSQKNHGRRIV